MNSSPAEQLKLLAKKHKNNLLFIPLGGVGEIGMNAYLYYYAGIWVLIDAGIGFADYRMPGIDTLLPDFSFLGDLPLDALLVTHPHEDHIGAIPQLLIKNNIPLYMGEFTEHLVTHKLGKDAKKFRIHRIKDGEVFKIGKLEIMPRAVAHSVPEAFAFYLKCDFGLVVHSGDWKYDSVPVVGHAFDVAGWQLESGQIKAMICDSTNIMVQGNSGSEGNLSKPLRDLIAECVGGRVFVTCFASNVARLNNIMHAAHQAGRRILLLGRAMHRIYAIGHEMGWFENLPSPCTEDEIDNIAPGNLAIIVTGSQGEGRSMLAKIARMEYKKLQINSGDKIFFSSRTIPGNELAIADVQNQIARQGGEVVNVDEGQIHVSGHYQRDEIDRTYAALNPEWVIPVHGEARHLRAHCKIAAEMGLKSLYLPANGAVVAVSKEGAAICDEIMLQTQMVEPNGRIITVRSKEFMERKKIIWNGALVMALAVSRDDDRLEAHPRITPIGLNIDDEMLEEIENKAEQLYQTHYHDSLSLAKIIEKIESLMRKESRSLLKKRPVIAVNLLLV